MIHLDDLMEKIPTFLCKPPSDIFAQDHYVPVHAPFPTRLSLSLIILFP